MTVNPDRVLMEGTDFQTPVYINDSGVDGPVAMVVGGQHGIEPAGWAAAAELATKPISRGTIVVVPYACQPAIRQERYTPDQLDGDLNGMWPPDDEAGCGIAKEIWGIADEFSPEIFLDLHSSGEPRSRGGVGQCIFPTEQGVDAAERTVQFMNEYCTRGYGEAFDWSVGNVQGVQNEDTLIDRVGWLVAKPGWIIETSRAGTSLHERVEWTVVAASRLLRHHGVDIGF